MIRNKQNIQAIVHINNEMSAEHSAHEGGIGEANVETEIFNSNIDYNILYK